MVTAIIQNYVRSTRNLKIEDKLAAKGFKRAMQGRKAITEQCKIFTAVI